MDRVVVWIVLIYYIGYENSNKTQNMVKIGREGADRMIKVIKKDGTKEDFNVQKVVVAVNKSAYRALIKFTDEELDYIL